MRIDWHGHNCFHVTTKDGVRVLIDPFLEASAKSASDFEPDVILLTHGHGDHTGSVLEFREAHVVSNWEIGHWLNANGITNRTAMNTGGFAAPVEGLRVWMAPAAHSSGIDAAKLPNGTIGNGGSPCGFILDDGETRFHVVGDSALFGDMRTVIRDVMKPHVAAVPIGDLFTMGPEHAAIAVEWLGVKVAVPCHYDTFPPIEQDPQRFVKAVGEAAEVVVPMVDEGFDVVGGRLARS